MIKNSKIVRHETFKRVLCKKYIRMTYSIIILLFPIFIKNVTKKPSIIFKVIDSLRNIKTIEKLSIF